MDDIESEFEEVEFALREYEVATEHLMAVLAKHESVPGYLGGALILLSRAIEMWADDPSLDGRFD